MDNGTQSGVWSWAEIAELVSRMDADTMLRFIALLEWVSACTVEGCMADCADCWASRYFRNTERVWTEIVPGHVMRMVE